MPHHPQGRPSIPPPRQLVSATRHPQTRPTPVPPHSRHRKPTSTKSQPNAVPASTFTKSAVFPQPTSHLPAHRPWSLKASSQQSKACSATTATPVPPAHPQPGTPQTPPPLPPPQLAPATQPACDAPAKKINMTITVLKSRPHHHPQQIAPSTQTRPSNSTP